MDSSGDVSGAPCQGAALLTAGLAAVIPTLTLVADGRSLTSVIVNAQLAGLLLAGFARNETRHREPLIDRHATPRGVVPSSVR